MFNLNEINYYSSLYQNGVKHKIDLYVQGKGQRSSARNLKNDVRISNRFEGKLHSGFKMISNKQETILVDKNKGFYENGIKDVDMQMKKIIDKKANDLIRKFLK